MTERVAFLMKDLVLLRLRDHHVPKKRRGSRSRWRAWMSIAPVCRQFPGNIAPRICCEPFGRSQHSNDTKGPEGRVRKLDEIRAREDGMSRDSVGLAISFKSAIIKRAVAD